MQRLPSILSCKIEGWYLGENTLVCCSPNKIYMNTSRVQVCRNINQIKICMETGRTVILLNLENLYEIVTQDL